MVEELRVRVIRDYEGVEEIRHIWTSWQAHPNSDIDFYLTVLRSRSEIERPHILVLCRNDRPEAILVGRIERARLEFRVGYKTFYRAPVRQLTLIYGGRLGNFSAENCEVLVGEVMNSLRRGEADIAFLNHARTDSSLYETVAGSSGLLSCDHFRTPVRHWRMRLPSTVEELHRSIPGDMRREVRRRARALEADHAGNIRIERLHRVSDLDSLFQNVEEVAKKTYQRGLGVGFFDNADTRRYRNLEAQKGWLRAYILYVADKPCAFWMGTQYREVFHSGDVGYDPSFKKYSPGTMLLVRILEDLCREKVREMDFGLGDAEWKLRFGNRNWQEASAYLFAPTLQAVALNACWTPTMLMNQIVSRALNKAGLIQRLKTIWRNRVRPQPTPLPASE